MAVTTLENQSGYQYSAPTLPRNWNSEEKRFYNQMLELFDRLFSMKFGGNRIKANAISAKHLSLDALENMDLSENIAIRPVIEFIGAENLAAGLGLDSTTLNSIIAYVQNTVLDENGVILGKMSELRQASDNLEVRFSTVEDGVQKLGTYLRFDANDFLIIGREGDDYYTQTRADGYYIMKGAPGNSVEVLKITDLETTLPVLRVLNHLYIGAEQNGYLDVSRSFGGYGISYVPAPEENL